MIGGTWETSKPDGSGTINLPKISVGMVLLPVFIQAPWVRINPYSALLFTGVFLIIGVVISLNESGRLSDIGTLLVGFSGSWMAGCLFWGWLSAHPVLHIPIEAFALPIALPGLRSKWKLACSFYLASLVGTAFTDLIIALTGGMHIWPLIVTAPSDQASTLLHAAGLEMLRPGKITIIIISTFLIVQSGRSIKKTGKSCWNVAASVLIATVWIDGFFLITALLQPSFSGLIG